MAKRVKGLSAFWVELCCGNFPPGLQRVEACS